jgi:hypothetical protein
MLNKLLKSFWFLPLLVLTSCATNHVTYGSTSFFEYHTFFQLLGWVLFPRMMFWFFSAIHGGFFFWAGVFFFPRIMVAIMATTYYWSSNPFICIIAWIVALSGEATEKAAISSA